MPGVSHMRHHYIIINFVLNRTEPPLSMCICHATPYAYLDLCQLINIKEDKDAIPQVVFNNKELQPNYSCTVNCTQLSKTEWKLNICHSSVVSTTLTARDNDGTIIDFSSQQDLSATWKLLTYTTNYLIQYS